MDFRQPVLVERRVARSSSIVRGLVDVAHALHVYLTSTYPGISNRAPIAAYILHCDILSKTSENAQHHSHNRPIAIPARTQVRASISYDIVHRTM